MAWRVEHNPLERILELLVENGLGDLREPMTVLLNEAMKLERARHLGAGPWERSERRTGHANGFKEKTLKTRIGECRCACRRRARAISTLRCWSAASAPSGRSNWRSPRCTAGNLHAQGGGGDGRAVWLRGELQ